MPIYEYRCKKCGEVFEVFQKISDPPPKKHSCGSKRVQRVMSRTSFQLKGEGWYITDYARKDADKKAKRKGEGAPGSEGDAKTDKSDKADKADKSEKKAGPKASAA